MKTIKEHKFRFWDKELKIIFYRKPAYNDFTSKSIIPLQYTGFRDAKGIEIFDGDILSDLVKTDEGIIKSKQQVFWNQPTGSWHLDNSFSQDMTCSTELWLELNDFDYQVIGNIYEKKLKP